MGATDGPRGSWRAALTAACGILGVAGAPAQATEVSAGMLGYVEPGRVSALELISDGRHEFPDGKVGTFRFVVDALTGSSANGGLPAAQTQTFTSPSGRGSYTVEPGATPLDGTFKDTRFAVSAGLSLPWGRLTTASLGLYGSTEHDYTSLGVNGTLARDFNRRNTSLTLRVARYEDTVNPEGGIPAALTAMPAPTGGGGDDKRDDDGGGDSRGKSVTDLGLGLTQVLGRRTLLSLNYTNSRVGGYQTDPYKLLAVVDGTTGAPRAADPYLFENRPDRRLKHAVAGELRRNLGRDVVTLAYRYFDDDWGVNSQAVDLDHRLNFAAGQYLQPSVRWYHQTEAAFYRRYLVDGDALPRYASADYRLGDMTAMTYGLKYGRTLDSGNELTMRVAYYVQTGEHHPAGAIGQLRDFDLFPTVDAWIVNVGYTFGK